MTTVAWRNGTLAVDRQVTSANLKHKSSAKWVETDEHVWVIAGGLTEGMAFIRHLLETGEWETAPKPAKTDIIQMDMKTGKLVEYEEGYPVEIDVDKLAAWGTGRELAIGAMAMGATAKEAVKVASAWDIFTGMGIQEFISERAKSRDKAKRQKVAE